jgi:hypothetical protein
MIKRFGFLDTAQTWALGSRRRGREAFMQVRRIFILSGAVLVLAAGPQTFAQRNNDTSKQPTRSAQEQQDIQALVQTVEMAMLSDLGIPLPAPGAPAPAAAQLPAAKPLTFGAADSAQGEIPLKWESNHFVKGQTDTYVPFTLQLDRGQVPAGAAMWVRVVNAEQAASFASALNAARQAKGNQPPARTSYAWDNVSFIDVPDGGKLSRAIQLRPGQYVAYIAVKEKTPAATGNQRNDRNRNDRNAAPAAAAPGKYGLLRHEITVPDFAGTELTTSSVIVARSVEPVTAPPTDQESNPYVFGPMRIVPSPDGKFGKSAELSIIFWIYGAQAAASGKPDVTIDYNFYQKQAEADKYFNKTAPQQLNAQTLPPEFSVAAGHQLPGSLVVPLTSFPSGDYRLEIKVTDKASGKSVTQNVTFTVLPV